MKARESIFRAFQHERHRPERDACVSAVPTYSPDHPLIGHDARMPRLLQRERNRAHTGAGFNRSHTPLNVRIEEEQTRIIEPPPVGCRAIISVKFRWRGQKVLKFQVRHHRLVMVMKP
jgi:hypothetical protein